MFKLIPCVGSTRPIRYAPGEINGTVQRGKYMISIAEESLKDYEVESSEGSQFKKFIKKVPLGMHKTID